MRLVVFSTSNIRPTAAPLSLLQSRRPLTLTESEPSLLQIDLLIQETSRLLQLTIEHDPHSHEQERDSSGAEDQGDDPLSTPPSEGPSPTLPIITQPPNPDICHLRSRIIT